jgi:hypothetical protein
MCNCHVANCCRRNTLSVEEAKQLFEGSWPELRVLIVRWDWLLCIEHCPMSSAWHELTPALT